MPRVAWAGEPAVVRKPGPGALSLSPRLRGAPAAARSAPPLLARPVPHSMCDSAQPFRGDHSCHHRGGRARFRERPAPGRTPPGPLGGCPDGTCREPPHCLRALPGASTSAARGRADARRCPAKRPPRERHHAAAPGAPPRVVCNNIAPADTPVTHARLANGAETGRSLASVAVRPPDATAVRRRDGPSDCRVVPASTFATGLQQARVDAGLLSRTDERYAPRERAT
jgi:hypothetical protein